MADILALPDRHVHTEWSDDATRGDMLATCARAVELGLPAIALTEHADFTDWVQGGEPTGASPGSSKDPGPESLEARPPAPPGGEQQGDDRPRRTRWDWSSGRLPGRRWPVRVPTNPARTGDLDIAGYWEALERCRARFPGLRIESGIELGEPHLFPRESAALCGHRPLDRILGSLHCLDMEGELVDMSVSEMLAPAIAADQFRRYLRSTLDLVEGGTPFAILTHIDYPKRYWPHAEVAFEEADFEEEYRAVLRALARSGRALEVNSNRAMGPPRAPSPGLLPLRWWREAGGQAVSFGSDAHSPDRLAAGLREAADLAEAAGFRPSGDPLDLWVRA